MTKKKYYDEYWATKRQTVFVRDQYQCQNCGETSNDGDTMILDPDHNVPRGAGGSDRFSNVDTLCRRCHDAKHGIGIAPTVRWMSTGTMTDSEFAWYKHFMNQMLPTLTRAFDVGLYPMFNLPQSPDEDAWHLPLGDLRRLDKQLLEADDQYRSLQVHQYM